MRFLTDILAKAGLVVDGTTTLNGAAAATVDTDKFMVLDGAVVKYRTGAQVLSDIGAATGTVTSVSLATGTTGTDVNVSGSPITSSGTITINIPSASATARGLVTTSTQTFAGAKTFSGTSTTFSGLIDLGSYIRIQSLTLSSGSPTTGKGFVWYNNSNNRLWFRNDANEEFDLTATGSGTVTSVSVVSANGFAGTVATASTTPAITLSTTITGLLKGNGTAISAAVAGTDYLAPFGSQTANTFYAAPNGSAGAPTFRAIVAADIPTLNQNTTGSAGSVANSFVLRADSGTTEGTDIYTFNGSSAKNINIVAGTNMSIAKVAGQWTINTTATTNTGTVTSVAFATGTTGTDVNVSGSPITSSGTITLNIPDASATARGLVTTGTQTFGGAKTFSNTTTFSNDASFVTAYIGGASSGLQANTTEFLLASFATQTNTRIAFNRSMTAYTAINASGTSWLGSIFVGPQVTEPSSGNYGLVASVAIKAPRITAAAGTLDHSASLYISEADTIATNAYAIWVDGGNVRIDDNLIVGAVTNNGDKFQVTGNASVTGRVKAGNFTTGAGVQATDLFITDGVVRAGGGINFRTPVVGDANFIGFQTGGGDIQIWANNAQIGQFNAIGGNASGSMLRLGGYGFNPGSGTGVVNVLTLDNAVIPTGSNSIDITFLNIDPGITQSTFGTGTIRGVYFNPSVTSLNTSVLYAWESTAGKMKISDLAGSGTRMVVADSSGVLSTQAIPSGSGTSTTRYNENFTATSNQTAFTVTNALTNGYFDVYLNGVKLDPNSFTNTSTVITLVDGAAAGDILQVVNYSTLGIVSTLPSQTGNSGKYLTTDGTNLSWATVSSGAYTVTSVSTTYSETATSGTKIIKANTTGGTFTITLPTAVGNTATLIIKKTAGSADLTIDGAGSETIDGGATATVRRVDESVTLISDNSNWFIV